MTTLTQDIQDAIRKSLPEQTAAELKDFIQKAQQDAAELVKCKEKLELSITMQADQVRMIAKAGNLETRENLVKGKEVELLARETTIKHQEEILKIATANAHARYNDALSMMQIVFKSQPTGYAFSRQVNESGSQPQHGEYGGTTSVSKTSNEYTTKREITE
jgi:fructose-specific component phosphotransferase system IIB-like protein